MCKLCKLTQKPYYNINPLSPSITSSLREEERKMDATFADALNELVRDNHRLRTENEQLKKQLLQLRNTNNTIEGSMKNGRIIICW